MKGSIFDSHADALVNPVNCVGVMGAGLALQFKRKFPGNFLAYVDACKSQRRIGRMFVYKSTQASDLPFIVNFPTKLHWRDPSRLEYISEGLNNLVEAVDRLGIKSIAIPALGCGLGGLDWNDVLPLILDFGKALPESVDVLVYGPASFKCAT